MKISFCNVYMIWIPFLFATTLMNLYLNFAVLFHVFRAPAVSLMPRNRRWQRKSLWRRSWRPLLSRWWSLPRGYLASQTWVTSYWNLNFWLAGSRLNFDKYRAEMFIYDCVGKRNVYGGPSFATWMSGWDHGVLYRVAHKKRNGILPTICGCNN